MCVCACVRVCARMCMCMSTRSGWVCVSGAYVCVSVCADFCVRTFSYMYSSILSICMLVCMQYMYASMYARMQASTYADVGMYVDCIYVCIYACICIYIYKNMHHPKLFPCSSQSVRNKISAAPACFISKRQMSMTCRATHHITQKRKCAFCL